VRTGEELRTEGSKLGYISSSSEAVSRADSAMYAQPYKYISRDVSLYLATKKVQSDTGND